MPAPVQNFEDVTKLSGVQKAAVLVLSLAPEASGRILKELNEEVLEEVSREMASIGSIPRRVRFQVVEEFYHLAMARAWVTDGGLEHAKRLLRDNVNPRLADKIIQQISQQVQQSPFSFLQKAESGNLLTFIQEEHPQTIALITSHLPHHKAAEILAGLPTQKQTEVVKRVANMEQTNPEVVREVERGLEARLSNMLSQSFEQAGGVESVAEMLNLVDRTTEKGIMEGLEAQDPDLVEQIRRLMFIFEDVLLVDDKGIQAVLKEVDNDELALALKTASEELREKVFGNMSERARELIAEDMEYMGPVRVADVEAAQQRIVDVIRRLEDAGEIVIAGRGGEKDLVV